MTQDLVVFLLEGDSLQQAGVKIKKKYGKKIRTVSLDGVSDAALKDERCEEENIRTVSPGQKDIMRREFHAALSDVSLDKQAALLLKSYGYKDREIAVMLKDSHINIRQKIHRSLKEIKA